MTEKTKGATLYVAEVAASDWGRVRRAINRLGADYLKITTGAFYKILTDEPLKGSVPLDPGEVRAFLESAIPSTAYGCPISTSRNWQRGDKRKKSDYKAVVITWLPVKEQTEVAKDLGATVQRYARWLSPEDANDAEWEVKFKEAIEEREKLLRWCLRNSECSRHAVRYLKQQYIKDALEDERGGGDMVDIVDWQSVGAN
jgi:hypothetical protein